MSPLWPERTSFLGPNRYLPYTAITSTSAEAGRNHHVSITRRMAAELAAGGGAGMLFGFSCIWLIRVRPCAPRIESDRQEYHQRGHGDLSGGGKPIRFVYQPNKMVTCLKRDGHRGIVGGYDVVLGL